MLTSEESLWDLIKDLRAENAALLEIILRKQNLLHTEEVVSVSGGPDAVTLGKEPWYRKQARLERAFHKPRLSEISGIPDELDQAADAASIPDLAE